ncbi:MAG TPA: potassium channel family protein [Stellaceae bacterium]|nr:potassium channel family protein [Stellaceae bacterium]
MSDKRVQTPDHRLRLAAADRRDRIRTWQERIRDPALTVLLALNLCTIFFAVPLAARGLPLAKTVAEALVLAVLVIVVMLSHRPGAIVAILFGAAAIEASEWFGTGWPQAVAIALRGGGNIIAFSALTWVVGHAVYAGGRITSHRLQGAAVVYLNLATIFASAYGLIWQLQPDAFANLHTPSGDPLGIAEMMYFSLATLTTTGYGDIVAVDPFARSLANLESVLGVFYIAITVARLVTLETENRRR